MAIFPWRRKRVSRYPTDEVFRVVPPNWYDAEQAKNLVVKPGQGISLFLKRYIGEKFQVLDEETKKTVDKKLQQTLYW